ncbi:PAS domain S-box protein [Methanosarcina sp. WWM596]|uniref:PAS domain S-box protein n=1 Tax=Methanosarcina sp. WWM596 TaxID=1434103 RepID=UPI000615B88C|nr:PAS domain S-box protein [Methanosarcina sp. WWM596]AKB19961.1 sensory transduction histidine kinase [Methanosarcina sp. WWM596]
MNEYLRQSGIDFIGNVPWGTHFCQFYQTKEDLTDILVPYFKAGLENKEFCMWVTSQPLDVGEAKEALKKVISDIDVYLEKGQIEIIPYTHWYVKEGVFNSDRILNDWVEKLNYALERGYEGLRLAGNTSLLEKEDWENFVEYEKKMDSVISSCRMIALCTYSLDVHGVTEAIGIAANHQFTLVKKERKWEKIKSSNRQNIIERKRTDEALRQSEQRVRLKLGNILSPSRKMANLELADIIDAQAIKSLMDEFYKLTQIPVGLLDLKGNILVGVGWQDICTEFHRIHPETCKHCVESDTKLSVGVAPGEFKLYRCKNNMWDTATPIIVGDQHIGNIFLGQFFFEDEPLDYELFRTQARQYGFNEKKYIAALEKVPRLSRETVNTIMVFFMKLANMLSQLGYSNIKLARSLAERDVLVDALRKSEKRERARSEELAVVLDAVPVAVFFACDPEALHITGNRLSYEWLRIPVGTNFSKSTPEGEQPEMFKLFKDGVELPPENMPSQMSATGIEINNCELDIASSDGEIRHILGNARPLHDEQGNLRGSISAFIDITERKKAEEALKKVHENLEEKVKERTTQLEKAYKSLKESEKELAEAQKMAHIGNWDWDITTDKTYRSEELYRIFGREPQESGASFDEFLNFVHPDDREYVNNSRDYLNIIKKGLSGESQGIDYRIILDDGEERTVHSQTEVIFDEKNTPIRVKGTIQDITKFKKSEEKIKNLADIVESSNDAIGTLSLDGVITGWNKGAEQVYGYSAKEILGKTVSILAPSHLDEETKRLAEMVKKGEKIYNYETSRLRKDGKVIDVSLNLFPVFDISGKLTTISVISRDVTESKKAEEKLKESEEKYRNIVETANEGICVMDADTIVTYANKKMIDMLGYTLEEGIGRPILDFFSEESKAIVKLNVEKRRQDVNENHEYKLIRKDGSSLWVLISSKFLFDKDGKFMGWISMLTDITKRKEAEKTLENTEIARKKEIHHRIKNNLQVISSLLDLQAEKFNNKEYIKDSEVLEAFRESQDRVISIALIHEELHSGGGSDTLNFSPYLEKLVENLFLTYSLGDVDISLDMDLEKNIFFDMDTAVPLGIIVNELISNSLKHAFPGRNMGEIKIKLIKEEKVGNELSNDEEPAEKATGYTLIVSDDGVGIPEKIDLENSDTLGLQLVNILVNQLDGEIKLKRDAGTEFKIRINV